MVGPLRQLSRAFSTLDARAATSLLLSAVLSIAVVLMLVYGQEWLNLHSDGKLERLIDRVAQSPFAVFWVVLIFTGLAFTGFPQFVMIAATITAFGALTGAVYAWAATMVSAGVTFFVGRFMGAAPVERFTGDRVRGALAFLSRRGVIASALIRVVPSGPFILVNAFAGAARLPVWKYALGTGIGITPKIAFVAAITSIAARGMDGPSGPHLSVILAGGLMIAVLAVWIGVIMGARLTYHRLQNDHEGPDGPRPDGPRPDEPHPDGPHLAPPDGRDHAQ